MKWLIVAAIALAGSAGFLTAIAVGGPAALTPSKTVTVDIPPGGATGPQGPQGEPGPPGPGLSFKGSVATPADLPQTGNKQGDTYVVSSDGSMQVWDGTKWVSGGPVGGAASESCPAGSTFGRFVIHGAVPDNAAIYVCIVD
jgi:hypothetical protein